MIRVLMMESSLGIGGQEKISIELSQLDRDIVRTDFLVAGDDIGPFREYLEERHYRIIHIASPRDGYLRYFFHLRKCVKEYGPYDILYSNGVLNNGLNVFYGYLLRIPKRISHCHSSNSGRDHGVISKAYEWFMKLLIRRFATMYLSCGEAAGVYLYGSKLYKTSGIEIPNGVDASQLRFRPEVRARYREQLNIGSTTKVYGIVARFSKEKNHIRLLKIFRKILDLNQDSALLLIGDGELSRTIEDTVSELGLDDSVLLLGRRDDIPGLLWAMDFFVLPSEFEGVPVSLIEAQAAGLKCIVSSNVSKEVDITGTICFFDLAETDEALASLFERQGSIDRVAANKAIKESKYCIEKSRKKILDLYLS